MKFLSIREPLELDREHPSLRGRLGARGPPSCFPSTYSTTVDRARRSRARLRFGTVDGYPGRPTTTSGDRENTSSLRQLRICVCAYVCACGCRARKASALGRARRFREEVQVGRRTENCRVPRRFHSELRMPCSWDREFRATEFVYTYAGPALVLKFLRVEVFIPSFTYANPWRPQRSVAKCSPPTKIGHKKHRSQHL
ncbi:hypothetical protein GY45DRAFT_1332164 [Cubamyces sp. BRFM 1775]|nr:hypothetical protein GY45DRAFT_1332164 [Cubamyces sp. BRFM 1775]